MTDYDQIELSPFCCHCWGEGEKDVSRVCAVGTEANLASVCVFEREVCRWISIKIEVSPYSFGVGKWVCVGAGVGWKGGGGVRQKRGERDRWRQGRGNHNRTGVKDISMYMNRV